MYKYPVISILPAQEETRRAAQLTRCVDSRTHMKEVSSLLLDHIQEFNVDLEIELFGTRDLDNLLQAIIHPGSAPHK